MSDTSRRPNFEIVLKAIREREGQLTVHLPMGIDVGWYDGKLCYILSVWRGIPKGTDTEPDEEHWVECNMSVNAFNEQCAQLSEETIVNLVFSTAMKRVRNL